MTTAEERPRPLQAHFDLTKELVLYRGPATAYGLGDVVLTVEFNPQPEPTITATVNASYSEDEAQKPRLGLLNVVLPDGASSKLLIDHVTTNWQAGSEHQGPILKGSVVEQCRPSTAIVAMDFQFFNGSSIAPTIVLENERGAVWLGRTVIEVGDWRLIIEEPPSSAQTPRERLQRYRLSHTGRIERRDGSSFTVDEADGFRHSVAIALSMATGLFVSPTMITGVDTSGSVVHTDWVEPRIDPDHAQWVLLGRSQPRHFEDFFRLVLNLEEQEGTREVTSYVVGYYLEANSQRMQIELELSAAQTAMTILAWDLLVEQGSTTPSEFTHMPAADMIRTLLTRANIDSAIPSSFQSLDGFATLTNCGDGPEVITRLRNKVAHPRQPGVSFGQGVSVWIEAWQLSMNYLQLLLLHRWGYQGTYLDRVKSHSLADTISVPWATGG